MNRNKAQSPFNGSGGKRSERYQQIYGEDLGQRATPQLLAQLRHRIQWLADNPHLGIQRSDIRPDLYSFPEGEHLIFYSITTDNIDIVGVLHNRMLAKDKLS